MDSLIQMFRNLGPAKIGAMAGITVALLGFFIFLTTRLGAPDMTLLYGNIDPADSNQIQMQLAAEGLPFEIRENGEQILVPSDQVGNIRLKMAEKGLSGSVVGYELFDTNEALGSSSFMQEVNRTRALEGELSRTISSLSNVKSSRVHLVLPKRELFSRETQEPSASIILKMKGAQRLDRTQILAIQHLVATAVQRLKPSMISIVDDRGTLLAKGGDEDSQGTGEMLDMPSQYEASVRKDVEQLLERTLGYGKVRVEVRADMDFTQTVINEEKFDPEGQVLRSTSTTEASTSLKDGGDQTVTVGNNLPDAPGGLEGVGGTSEAENSITETSNYEITKILTNTVVAPGKVNSMSVAVLIDGYYERGAPTEDNDEGEIEYQARSAEEMQQIETLVKSAMGFDASRGDTVEIVNMRFAESTLSGIEEEPTYFGLSAADVKWLAQTLILGMLAVLVILLVVRPLIGKLLEATPNAIAAAAAGMEEGTLITDQSGQVVAVAGAPASMSVAVLIDGYYERGAPTEDNDEGEIEYQARSAEEMQQIETLVKSAMGFDASRGDTVEIVNMRFAESTLSGIEEEPTYFGLSAADVKWLAQTLILGMLAVLVILLVVRPLIGKLLEATPNAIAAAAAGMEEGTLITDQSGQVVAVAGAPASTAGGLMDGEFQDEEEDFENMLDLAHIEGRVKASSMKKIAEIIDKHPEEAVSIIRSWMYQEQA